MSDIRDVLASRRRLFGAVLCVAAMVLTVVATFLPLAIGGITSGGETEQLEFTSWVDPSYEGEDSSTPKFGIPMVFAAAVLLVAALTLLVSALPSVRLGTGRAGASLSLAGSAMLVGVTWGITLYVSFVIEVVEASEGPREQVDLGFGAGFWLLVAGLVLAVAATVLAKLPNPSARYGSPEYPTQFDAQPAGAVTAQPYPPALDGPTRELAPRASPDLGGHLR